MRIIALSFAAALWAASAGCIVHTSDHPHGGPPGQARTVVVVEASHICADTCAHFYLDGVWYIETGHRHSANCGHYLVKGKWGGYKGDDSSHPHGGPPGQTKKTIVVEASHVCFDSCDHYCIDGVWYVETGHKHGSNCGHYLVKGKWGKDKDKGDDHDQGKDKGKKDKKDKKDKD